MTNYVQLQNDLAHSLLSAESLAAVNVMQWRKLRHESEVARAALWLTMRNGRSGAGVCVEMPEFRVTRPNLPGPEAELVLGFSVVEEPNINKAPGAGSELSAEEISQIILEELHGRRYQGTKGFPLIAAQGAIVPTNEWGPGVLSYRVELTTRMARAQKQRVVMPTISVVDGVATLACGTAEAEIRYTLTAGIPPESVSGFPGPSNAAAKVYDAPFPVNAGEIIRAAGWKPGLLGSDENLQLVS